MRYLSDRKKDVLGSGQVRQVMLQMILLFLLVVFSAGATGNLRIDLVAAARSQIGETIVYDPSYQIIGYPNGDVSIERGVCTDVVIRAMRSALTFDLQQRVHEDMQGNFSSYPQNWGLTQPDKNIDHRRVANLQVFFKRQGWALPHSDNPGDFRPGDIVTCTVPPHLPHIMIVSDKKNGHGVPLVIHNIGAGVQEEDRLFDFERTGHYRVPGVQ